MLKRRVSGDILTGTTGGSGTGTATIDVGLGAAHGRVVGIEIKGDDANVDVNNTFELVDAHGKLILKATAVDAGADDSTLKSTAQDLKVPSTGAASTVGVYYDLVGDEARALQGSIGAVTTDNVGAGSGGVPATSPVTINLAAGTDGDYHRVVLWVEV